MYDNRLAGLERLWSRAHSPGASSLAIGYVVFSRNEKKLAELL